MKTFNEFTQLNEVSKKLALAVASKRVKQGMAHRLAQSKVNPNSSAGDKRLYKSLGDRADTLHTKAQKSHEYAFRKGVVSEEHLAPGTSVSFPHNGKMKKGKVVGFRPGTGHTSSTQYGPDSYVIYHGEAESAIVPHHKVVKEEVQLDELKQSTLKSYIRKSYGDIGHQSGMVAHLKVKKYKHPWLKQSSADQLKFHTRKEKNRGEGIDRAVTKLGEAAPALKPLTQYTYVPNRGHFVGGKKGDKAFQKHQSEYMNRKKITPVKEDAMSPEHLHYMFAKAEHPKEYAASKIKKPKLKKYRLTRKDKDDLYSSLGMTKVKGALGGTYYEGVHLETPLDHPMQTKSVPKYQVGSTVKPKIGPHKGTKHTVIHVHPDGSYNIKPEVHVSVNRYRQGATRAQEKDLE